MRFTYRALRTMVPMPLARLMASEAMSYVCLDLLLRGSHWFLAQPVTPWFCSLVLGRSARAVGDGNSEFRWTGNVAFGCNYRC